MENYAHYTWEELEAEGYRCLPMKINNKH